MYTWMPAYKNKAKLVMTEHYNILRRLVMANTNYGTLEQQARALVEGVPYTIANLANISSLIFNVLPDLNWCGFYLLNPQADSESLLVLGPFQGKPACIEIPFGSGVCGTAAARNESIVVPNVHEFEGHIACDSASNSEIVIPLHKDDRVVGVLDVDSPLFDRFDEEDKVGLESIARIVESFL